MKRGWRLGGLLAACAFATAAPAAEPGDPRDDVKHMHCFQGSDGARKLLLENGFVVTDQCFRQFFEAYLYDPRVPAEKQAPFFITVDSIWHAYHVLFEEGTRLLEHVQAKRLRTFSERLYERAREKARAHPPYAALARFAAAGLMLQDQAAADGLSAVDRDEAERIARAVQAPSGSIDASFLERPLASELFQVESFYAEEPALAGLFRAQRWYASCAFRLGSARETERALLLALLVASDPELEELIRLLKEPFPELLGPQDDVGVAAYVGLLRDMGRLDEAMRDPDAVRRLLPRFIERARTSLPQPLINDQITMRRSLRSLQQAMQGFRLLPAYRTPAAILFQRTTDPEIEGRWLPSSVDLFCTGPLACQAGARAFGLRKDADCLEDMQQVEVPPLPQSLHSKTLRLLRKLQTPLPAAAPGCLRTSAWQDKQLWTALGIWAEQRHTWALRAKPNVSWECEALLPPAYVSPYPAFFDGLAALSRSTARVFERVLAPPIDRRKTAARLLACLRLAQVPFDQRTWWARAETEAEHQAEAVMETFRSLHDASDLEPQEVVAALKAVAARWRQEAPLSAKDQILLHAFAFGDHPVLSRLEELAQLCGDLARIARLQQAGRALAKTDRWLLHGYAQTLAHLQFYEDSAYLDPRDDLPIVSTVYISRLRNQRLYAGVGRPEALYVIIRRGGERVLHRGAVLNFREFVRDAEDPFTDAAWRERVRAGRIPPPPAFTGRFRRAGVAAKLADAIRGGDVAVDPTLLAGAAVTDALLDRLAEANTRRDLERLERLLRGRLTDEHVPRLVPMLDAVEDERREVGARLVRDLDWTDHAARLMETVRTSMTDRGEIAAYVLSGRPEALDLEALLAGFAKQPSRIQHRLLCFLTFVGGVEPRVRACIMQALADDHPAVRLGAIYAVRECGLDTEAVRGRLASRLRDPVPAVVTAAVCALGRLDVQAVAPRLLERLQKECAAADGTWKQEPNREEEAVLRQRRALGEASRRWRAPVRLTRPRFHPGGPAFDATVRETGEITEYGWPGSGYFSRRSLADVLVEVLVDLHYAPAKETFRKLFRRDARAVRGMEELLLIAPSKANARFLCDAAKDPHAGRRPTTFICYLETMYGAKSLPYLVELLDCRQPVREPEIDPYSAAEHAAAAIARILEFRHADTFLLRFHDDEAKRAAFIRRMRAAAGAAMEKGRTQAPE